MKKILRIVSKNIKTATLVAVFAISINVTPAWSSGTHDGGHTDADDIGKPGEVEDVSRTIEVRLNDNYYEPEEIKVTAGETIRFVLINDGEFVHEFNIGTPKMHAKHQDEMMMMVEHGVLEADKINYDMMDMDMGGGQTMDHDDPNSELLEPGDTVEIIWQFGEEVTLEFACNIPGHYDSGMAGEFSFSH